MAMSALRAAKEKLIPKSDSPKRHETRENYTILARYGPKSQLYLLLNPTSIGGQQSFASLFG